MVTWDNIIGHQWAVQLLADAIQHDRMGHAYLLTGPAQIGKTTLARTLAQALNCENIFNENSPQRRKERQEKNSGETPASSASLRLNHQVETGPTPCGECRACRLIAADRHPDMHLIEPEISGRGQRSLKIDRIRELQRDLNLATYEARTKVAILTHFEAATTGAANAFLKTLEEPPGHVTLLLTANDADTLLPTITSRCRVINLRPLPADQIEQALATRWAVPLEQATLLAHLADGRLGWAVEAAQDPAVLQARHDHLDQLYHGLAGDRVTRFALADKLGRQAETLPATLRNWLSWWRDLVLLTQYQGGENGRFTPPLTNIDQQSQLQTVAQTIKKNHAFTSLQQTSRALWQLERNANTRLVVENLLLTYPLEIGGLVR